MENLVNAFGMLALAIASHQEPRSVLLDVTKDRAGHHALFRFEPLDTDQTTMLEDRVLRGDVTTIVKEPMPFVFIYLGKLRTVYGVWLQRQASWKGKRAVIQKPMLTGDEAGLGDITDEQLGPVVGGEA